MAIKESLAKFGEKAKNFGKSVVDHTSNMINDMKIKSEQVKTLNDHFEKNSLLFVCYLKNGKSEKCRGILIRDENKIKLDASFKKDEIEYFQDSQKNNYYIEFVNPEKEKYKYQGQEDDQYKELTVYEFTLNKPVCPITQNISIDSHNTNIKAKNSNINSPDSTIQSNTEISPEIDFNLSKKTK